MNPALYKVPNTLPGQLFITARPRGGDWLTDEVLAWRRAGINAIVDLLEPQEKQQLDLTDERLEVERSEMDFISLPIADRGVPASTSESIAVISEIFDLLAAGKNVAVHCRQGIGRSGMIAAGVLVKGGLSPQMAMDVVSSSRGLTTPETAEQVRWVEALPANLLVLR
jgi:protein-tyrosine phosphatase